MTDILYDLVFKGDRVKGVELGAAKRNIQALFKITENKVEVLFSGNAVTLKKGLSFEAASKYRVAIKKAGAIVELVEQTAAIKKPTQGKAVFGAEEPGAKSNPSAQMAHSSVSEPVIRQTAAAEDKFSEAKKSHSGSSKISPSEGVNKERLNSPSAFELAPVGADVLSLTGRGIERDVTLDLSHYALANQEGNLVDAHELRKEAVTNIPDSELISLAEAGEDILSEDQKHHEPESDINVSGVSLAETGATIIEPKEEAPVTVDVSHLSLTD